MELVDGVELFDEIIRNARLSEAQARPIFAQLAKALQFLHAQRIIHRDVKPENVKVSFGPAGAPPNGGADWGSGGGAGGVRVKLLDFGLATSSEYGSTAKTFVGTPCYYAPGSNP